MLINKLNSLYILIFSLTLMVSCQGTSGTPEFKNQNKQVEVLANKREVYNKKIGDMNVPDLVKEALKDSERGMEPFNSSSYRELLARGKQVAPELRTSLSEKENGSLLGLLALRKIDNSEYRKFNTNSRVDLLVGSLRDSRTFNTWGIPHLYWEDAAKAIIAEGTNALKPLTELLNDKRPAPLWGSQEVVEYTTYQYRVCDYAWALIQSIKNPKLNEIPVEPADRDRLINESKTDQDK